MITAEIRIASIISLSFSLLGCNEIDDTATAESFIDAFYSFDQTELEPFLRDAPESASAITYYQGWAEGGNYKVLDRKPCIQFDTNVIECSITVEDDPIMALGIDFKVTDTFQITFSDNVITAVETSSDDPPIYFEAREWVRENLPDLIASPCQGFFADGTTPGECAEAMAAGYAQFAASEDFQDQ